MVLVVSILILVFIFTRFIFMCHFKKQKKHLRCAKIAIVIGSGGHTLEMINLIKTLNPKLYSPRLYIMANNDASSEYKIKELEKEFTQTFSESKYHIVKIPRSRKINNMPLKGIKVLELAGLAPAPFCGAILADFGASVIKVDKVSSGSEGDCLTNGKRSLALNLKDKRGKDIFLKLTAKSDVILEPFRKGVMENLGLGPELLTKLHPHLIYARLTGFGQYGPYSAMAGHDINFLSLSGVLSFLGRRNEKPTPPLNLIADFGGGSLTCAFGIVLALFERAKSGKGQVIDCSMVEGAAYLSSWLFRSQNLPIWGGKRGENILDTGAHFYETYETKDGKFIAVGCLESQFYELFINKLQIKELENQWNDFDNKKKVLTNLFKTKTRDEWCKIFNGTDACVTPVLDVTDVAEHFHNKERKSFMKSDDGVLVPQPAPRLSRTGGISKGILPHVENGTHTEEILLELGFTGSEIDNLHANGVIKIFRHSKL